MRRLQILSALLLSLLVACLMPGKRGPSGPESPDLASDPLNATYEIAGQDIALRNGRSAISIGPGMATKIRTKVVREPIYGDLDGDGDDDAALILVQDPGGSGTFFYVVAALDLGGRFRATNTVLLGDRIDLEEFAIVNRVIVVRYKDRSLQEPMSAPPTVEKTIGLVLEDGRLVLENDPGGTL